MDALELLLNRSSMPRVVAPGPDQQQLELLEAAALRVPDHMNLTPYECTVYQGEQLQRLSEIFTAVAGLEGLSDAEQSRAAQLPLRAPCLLIVSTRYMEEPKVPRQEQYASAACAMMAMQQMAFALGLGAVWRTGVYAESDHMKEALGIALTDDIVGFLYVGTPAVPTPIKPKKEKRIFKLP
ncbi:nitroreductase family protein [Aliidiomarina haloalkalitolerans]|uniref:Putative NAD(P)H nitroreductase n=1 Tax=Aliidiomarina haloalkalitolerans TaxID=859059 RepID=A0A432VYB3_9GAMM|nr:nitroreductase family protein [Aliidiomarina haloalkalitolerans]RUO21703.1 nitroreductase [Aliidiomarina haloalkalitolerans]